jgi:sugar/nucleoside kinase (ribokinase family)
MVDLYCLGGASVDLILEAPRFPRDGEKLFVNCAGQLAGGFIANTACAAAKLGLRTSWGGLVGGDAFTQTIMHDFGLFGVETSDAVVLEESSTDFTVIILPPSGERTILIVPALPTPPLLTSSIKQSLAKVRLGYTVFYEQDWFIEVAQLIHAGGGKVVVDMEVSTLKDIEAAKVMLRYTDIIFTSEEGIRVVTGSRTAEDGVEEILSLGPEIVVLTKGSEGAEVFTLEARYSTGVYDVPVKDTTGAGDCFHAAFLYGILSDWNLQHCLEFASAAAAILVQKIGARGGLPTLLEVQKFMKTNQKKENHN